MAQKTAEKIGKAGNGAQAKKLAKFKVDAAPSEKTSIVRKETGAAQQ